MDKYSISKSLLNLATIVLALYTGFWVGNQKQEQSALIEESTAVDSIQTVIDTVYIDRIETITKYKTIIQYETIYINNTSDSLQPVVRSNLRDSTREYLQGR